MVVALGVDFENITHTPAYRGLNNPNNINIDLVQNTNSLLNLFDRYDVSATFFVVADLVDTYPDLIQRIDEAGHEIASHTVTHCSLVDTTSETVVEELRRSKNILGDLTSSSVTGFRAPTCQISDYVYQALAAEGYDYSSSVMPSIPIPGFYSNNHTFSEATSVKTSAGVLAEIPLSVHPHIRFPISGAWIRLLGRTYTLHGMQSVISAGQDIVTYSHPWEFESLWETSLPFRNRFRTGSWLAETYEHILDLNDDFCTVGELVERTSLTQTYTAGKPEE